MQLYACIVMYFSYEVITINTVFNANRHKHIVINSVEGVTSILQNCSVTKNMNTP